MIKFVKLTHRNGEPIWVNPTQVMSVAPVFNEREDVVVKLNMGTI